MAVLLGTTLVSAAMAQDISTDRPSFSDGPLIVPKGHWQIEAGYTYDDDLQTFGEFLLRYPLSDRAELRLMNITWSQPPGEMLDPVVGTKLKLREGLALVLQSTVSTDHRLQPTAKLAFYDATTGLGGNLIVSDLEGFTQYAASLYLAKTLTKKTGVFAEVYRLMPLEDGGPSANFADVGVTYLLNSQTQLDARVGTGQGWFFGFGISYRF